MLFSNNVGFIIFIIFENLFVNYVLLHSILAFGRSVVFHFASIRVKMLSITVQIVA